MKTPKFLTENLFWKIVLEKFNTLSEKLREYYHIRFFGVMNSKSSESNLEEESNQWKQWLQDIAQLSQNELIDPQLQLLIDEKERVKKLKEKELKSSDITLIKQSLKEGASLSETTRDFSHLQVYTLFTKDRDVWNWDFEWIYLTEDLANDNIPEGWWYYGLKIRINPIQISEIIGNNEYEQWLRFAIAKHSSFSWLNISHLKEQTAYIKWFQVYTLHNKVIFPDEFEFGDNKHFIVDRSARWPSWVCDKNGNIIVPIQWISVKMKFVHKTNDMYFHVWTHAGVYSKIYSSTWILTHSEEFNVDKILADDLLIVLWPGDIPKTGWMWVFTFDWKQIIPCRYRFISEEWNYFVVTQRNKKWEEHKALFSREWKQLTEFDIKFADVSWDYIRIKNQTDKMGLLSHNWDELISCFWHMLTLVSSLGHVIVFKQKYVDGDKNKWPIAFLDNSWKELLSLDYCDNVRWFLQQVEEEFLYSDRLLEARNISITYKSFQEADILWKFVSLIWMRDYERQLKSEFFIKDESVLNDNKKYNKQLHESFVEQYGINELWQDFYISPYPEDYNNLELHIIPVCTRSYRDNDRGYKTYFVPTSMLSFGSMNFNERIPESIQ